MVGGGGGCRGQTPRTSCKLAGAFTSLSIKPEMLLVAYSRKCLLGFEVVGFKYWIVGCREGDVLTQLL